ncbi:hypothetical protein [Arthrobacter sp. UYEF3]|uniref:hypothetical protein n=1 Tax=Arthrobacter sp. UYEF3 TaxID=1756365 RepID=UPI0033953F36
MAEQKSGERRSPRTSVKGPLMFSVFWAVLAFFAVLIFATGGSAKQPRFDLAFTGAGIAFIVTLVLAAMLSMSYKDNAEHLGKGSGVNLSSRPPAMPRGGRGPQPGPEAGTRDAGTPDAGGDLR